MLPAVSASGRAAISIWANVYKKRSVVESVSDTIRNGTHAGKNEELDAEQQNQSLPFRILVSAKNRKVVRCKHENTKQDLVWNLDEDVGDEKSRPAVGFAWALSNLVHGALGYEARHDLLDEG